MTVNEYRDETVMTREMKKKVAFEPKERKLINRLKTRFD